MLSLLYGPTLTSVHDCWKSVALTIQIFVGKVISLFFNMLSRFVITFLPRNKRLLISWLQSPSSVILEPKKIKSVTFHCFPIYLPWRRYSQDSRIFSAYSPEHSSWAGMSVFPGSISPGLDFVAGTVQLRGLRVAKEKNSCLQAWSEVRYTAECSHVLAWSPLQCRWNRSREEKRRWDGTPPLATFRCRISRAQEF